MHATICAALICACSLVPVQAATIEIKAVGTISTFVDSLNLYGTPNADYAGATIFEDFVFVNPAESTSVNGSTTSLSIFSPVGGGSSGTSTINGNAFPANGNVNAFVQMDSMDNNRIGAAASVSVKDTINGNILTREISQQVIDLQSDIIGAIPFSWQTSFSLDGLFDCPTTCGRGTILHNISTFDLANNNERLTFEQDVGSFNVTSFTVRITHSVAEPTTLPLLGALGLLVTGIARRRAQPRQRAAASQS